MLNTAIGNAGDLSVALPLANGDYEVRVWAMEPVGYGRTWDLQLEGAVYADRLVGMLIGQWVQHGPYRVTVADGQLDLVLDELTPSPLLMGMSVHRALAVNPAAAVASDSGPYGYHATVTDATPVTGVRGGALRCDGADSQIAATVATIPTAGGATASVEFWMRWRGKQDVMPFGFDSPNGDLWMVAGSFGFNTAAGDLYGFASTGLRDRWVHVVAEFTNGAPAGCRIWLDGVDQALAQVFGTTTPIQTAADLRFSGWPFDSGYRFDGDLDELAIYNRALTADEIALRARTAENDFAAATAFRSLTFAGGGYRLTGAAIALSDGIVSQAGANAVGHALTLSAGQAFSCAAGELRVAGAIDTDGYALTVDGAGDSVLAGVVSDGGSLTKLGAGTLTLSANNTYTGATRAAEGTLLVDGAQGASAVTLVDALLGGGGTVGAITGPAGCAGVIRPGWASVRGTLTAASADCSTGATVRLRVAGYTAAGVHFDRLAVTGALVLGGSSRLLIDLDGLLAPGVATGVITCGTRTGAFSEVEVVNNPDARWAVIVDYRGNNAVDVRIAPRQRGSLGIGHAPAF